MTATERSHKTCIEHSWIYLYLLQFYLQLKNMAKHSVLSQLCFLSAQDQHSYEYIYVAQKKSPCILVTKISVHTVTRTYQIGQCWKKYQNSNYQKEKRVLIFFIRFQLAGVPVGINV